MASKSDLKDWVVKALKSNKGHASVLYVAKYIWENYEHDLKGNDLFYTWQYDMRWAAMELRKMGVMVAAKDDRRGKWTLK
ncbi:hypothetical protein V6582_07955 [Agrobacterium vitis]|uniref:hypothetical protein n=1 Tax=Agrobacterium vitis TaxID=373 RepID=UPI0012E9328C|nr:hypothetical protein [Agrobacterium vitis]MVA24969.1 hypothetical protein [Agrobacterium vitis]